MDVFQMPVQSFVRGPVENKYSIPHVISLIMSTFQIVLLSFQSLTLV